MVVFLISELSWFCGQHILSACSKYISFIKIFFFSWNFFVVGWWPKAYLLFISLVFFFFFFLVSRAILNYTLNTIQLSSVKRHKREAEQISRLKKKNPIKHISYIETRITMKLFQVLFAMNSIIINYVLIFVTQKKITSRKYMLFSTQMFKPVKIVSQKIYSITIKTTFLVSCKLATFISMSWSPKNWQIAYFSLNLESVLLSYWPNKTK